MEESPTGKADLSCYFFISNLMSDRNGALRLHFYATANHLLAEEALLVSFSRAGSFWMGMISWS